VTASTAIQSGKAAPFLDNLQIYAKCPHFGWIRTRKGTRE
jgi:hypothetical protein